MRWLLDSVILIDHFNGVEAATRFIAEESVDIALSPVTRAEVLTGFTDDHRPLAAELLDQFPTLAISAAEADLAAGLRRSEGWRLPDALQAAVARHNKLDLVTRNTKDFPPERYGFVMMPYALKSSASTHTRARR
ncbi:MAG: PIN domain-containing protein [Thiotrichales bacterium]|nr:PIN domain-containing protein [Thiotrichales bacterium]MCY4349357.1 PIN domain-containing protein [Thiotrichales bacterium]